MSNHYCNLLHQSWTVFHLAFSGVIWLLLKRSANFSNFARTCPYGTTCALTAPTSRTKIRFLTGLNLEWRPPPFFAVSFAEGDEEVLLGRRRIFLRAFAAFYRRHGFGGKSCVRRDNSRLNIRRGAFPAMIRSAVICSAHNFFHMERGKLPTFRDVCAQVHYRILQCCNYCHFLTKSSSHLCEFRFRTASIRFRSN